MFGGPSGSFPGLLNPTPLLPLAAAASFGKEAPTLTLDQRDFLPPAPKDNADNEGDEESSW